MPDRETADTPQPETPPQTKAEHGDPAPAFDPGRFRRELWVDALLRGGALFAVFLAFLVLLGVGPGGSMLSAVTAVGVIVGWVAIAGIGAGVVRSMPGLTVLLEQNPEHGEKMLAEMLGKRALPRWVRLMLYHRLAVLRHRQQNYVASSAIAQTLLVTERPGAAATHRAHLLLLLAEARLELRDVLGGWYALHELTATPLGLTEALQRMALRIRYELMVGRDAAVLGLVEQKMRLAELMPAPQCGALHAMLATAARRSGDETRYARLWPRVELFCNDQEIDQLRENEWA